MNWREMNRQIARKLAEVGADRRYYLRGVPAPPPGLRTMKGRRVPVTARDREHAVLLASTRPWWEAVQNPRHPVWSRGRYWFVLRES